MKDALSVFSLGRVQYEVASRLQEDIAQTRAAGAIGDVLLLLEHPPVITIGRAGGEQDILVPASTLRRAGIPVVHSDRGGLATYHGPGQLVAYPILKLADSDLHRYVWRLEEVVIRVLSAHGLPAGRLEEHRGVWTGGNKIAAIGLAVRDGVSRHGVALNVGPELAHFDLLVPCGIDDRGVTSMERELGRPLDMHEVGKRFVRAFADVFRYRAIWKEPPSLERFSVPLAEQPPWLSRPVSGETEAAVARMEHLLADLRVHTVCQEAQCPNLAECFGRGTATFMILGDACTRGCRFCAVRSGRAKPVGPDEPRRVAEAAVRLALNHVVITSVTRDDLPDGGAGQFAATVQAVRRWLPEATVEVLIPDFKGSRAALEVVLASEPNLLNHNLETVPRLYPQVRPRADYRRSLGLLAWTKVRAPGIVTKSGLMLGLGEHTQEVLRVFYDLRHARCDLITLGQYLQPTDRQLPVNRYLPPVQFRRYEEKAKALGFKGVAAGPLVRSSYLAEGLWAAASLVQ